MNISSVVRKKRKLFVKLPNNGRALPVSAPVSAANLRHFFPTRFLTDRRERVRSDLDAGREQRLQAPMVLFRGVEHGGVGVYV